MQASVTELARKWVKGDKMKVCVLGAGAMGSSIGGLLANGGSEVYLLDTWEEHVNAINSQVRMLFNIRFWHFVNSKVFYSFNCFRALP